MKKITVILGAMLLCLSATSAWADGIGLPVSGSLTLYPSGTINYFDSANGAVPPGYGNSTTNGTVVIGSGVEFGVTNGADLFTADFTGTTLTITDTCVGPGCGTTSFIAQFYSPLITGYTVDSYNFPSNTIIGFGFSPTFGASAGQFTYLAGTGFTGGSAVFDFSVAPATTPSPVPEPGTLGLMATGLVGVAGAIGRRFRA